MATEIERKYLVRHDGWRAGVHRQRHIRQAYLANTDRCSVRVRISEDHADINIKGMTTSMIRTEYEYPVPLADATDMLDRMCQGVLITKTRYEVHHAGHDWEVDVFEGENAGLVVAEIELDRVGASFTLPDWVGEEVTHDPRYLNIHLVERPWSRWQS